MCGVVSVIIFGQVFLGIVNKESRTNQHWGVTDGNNWRDLRKDKDKVIVISKPKVLKHKENFRYWYFPLFDFGILGSGELDVDIDVPQIYNEWTNTCETYAIDQCVKRGTPIFLIPVLWTTLLSFFVLDSDILCEYFRTLTDLHAAQQSAVVMVVGSKEKRKY